MSENGPKLYTNKPKKSQLKQQQKAKDFSSPAPNPMDPPPPPPASATPSSSLPPHKESFARRYKFVWPVLLAVNLALGAYLFVRTKKKDAGVEDGEVAADVPSTPATSTTALVSERPSPAPPILKPVKVPEPIPEHQQRELFKWILEEKRKLKPKDPEEKKRIDEEKAILKQYIRGKSIPSL